LAVSAAGDTVEGRTARVACGSEESFRVIRPS
jgi:hypothetical protein